MDFKQLMTDRLDTPTIFATVREQTVDGQESTWLIKDCGDYGYVCDRATTNGSLIAIFRLLESSIEKAKMVNKALNDGEKVPGYLVKKISVEVEAPWFKQAFF